MNSKKRVNKTFEESCRTGNLFIDQNDGIHWCISKESPNSRKFDKELCQLFACPNYISKEIESLSKKEKKIRGYIEKGKSIEFIMKNIPCSRSTYFRVKKRMDEDEKRLEKKQIESDEESKALEKIKPMPPKAQPPKRAPARNLVYQQKEKRSPIKLNLHGRYEMAIRNALDHSNEWKKYNIQEIRAHMEKVELSLNPVPVEYMLAREPYHEVTKDSYNTIDERKELYHVLSTGWKHGCSGYQNIEISKLDIEYRTPKLSIWIEKRLYLWEISHEPRGLKTAGPEKVGLTTEEWYQDMELPFPQDQELDRNRFIHERRDLERSGLLRAIEYHIKTELGISDEIERMCETPTEELTTTDIWHMKNLLRENPHHPYSDLLKDKIQDYENKGI